MPDIIIIGGATATGKSAAAFRVAKAIGGEIISADSMQVYRRMDVGTAKPNAAERAEVPHHMIDVCEPTEPYSLADWIAAARRAVGGVISRGAMPIVCGGTGLYIDTLVDGTSLSDAAGDESIRKELSDRAEHEGADALWRELEAVDPESAAAIHPNNVRRVIRALEIYRATGVAKSEWDRRSTAAEKPYDAAYFVVERTPRSALYERIDRRVDEMFAAGLEAEARALWEIGALSPESVGGQAIGYKELVPYFCGEITLAEAADAIKQATRRYAKRQETWFRRRTDAIRIDGDGAADAILELLRRWESPEAK